MDLYRVRLTDNICKSSGPNAEIHKLTVRVVSPGFESSAVIIVVGLGKKKIRNGHIVRTCFITGVD